ncbi:MAG: hypothetical protein ACTSSI_08470 [Candidatus Helarchaeota archaeon]
MNHKFKNRRINRVRCSFKKHGGRYCSCGWVGKWSKARRIPYPFVGIFRVKNNNIRARYSIRKEEVE